MVDGSLRPGPAGQARHKGRFGRPFDREADQASQSSSPMAYLLLYGTMYAAFGVASPFWPQLFESKGLTPQQIGLVLSAALLVRLAAGPLVGRVADILASLRLVLASCIVVAVLIMDTWEGAGSREITRFRLERLAQAERAKRRRPKRRNWKVVTGALVGIVGATLPSEFMDIEIELAATTLATSLCF